MNEVIVDIVADAVAVVVFSIGATVLATLGFFMERAGLASLLTGEVVVGLWYVYMGGVALFVGVYLLGYRQVARRVGALLTTAETASE